MAQEYARLTLLQPIKAQNDGPELHDLVIFRPTCRAMTDTLDSTRVQVQVERFVQHAVRGLNGTGEPLKFPATDLNAIDGSELASVLAEMSEDADRVTLPASGDGISEPLVYTLQHPIKMTAADDSPMLRQIEFQGRRVAEISEYLDARGETAEFHSFMRAFAKPLGVSPAIITDVLIDALDFIDYLVIRRQIMGKLVNARRRWKRAS